MVVSGTLKSFINLIFLTLILALVAYIGIAFFISTKINTDTKTKADAIIVLGTHVMDKSGKSNPCLNSRVEHAVKLYKDGYSKLLIMSGGTDMESELNEAEEMKKIAINHGIPETKIITENRASSTYENIHLSKLMMNYREIEDAIIVTENYHMPRAKMVSDKLGVKSYVSPVTDSECWNKAKYRSKYFLREPIAIAFYMMLGRL